MDNYSRPGPERPDSSGSVHNRLTRVLRFITRLRLGLPVIGCLGFDSALDRVARRLSSAQPAQDLKDRTRIYTVERSVQIDVEPLLDGADGGLHLVPGAGQRQRDLPSIVCRSDPLNEADADQSIDEPTRAPAAFAYQKLTEPGQGQRSMIAEDSQDLGLRRGELDLPKLPGEPTTALALCGEHEIADQLGLSHDATLSASIARPSSGAAAGS